MSTTRPVLTAIRAGLTAGRIELRQTFTNGQDLWNYLFPPVINPPKDLHVAVRVARECGVIQTEVGAIDFKKGHRYHVRRSDVEHLIVQGFLEEV